MATKMVIELMFEADFQPSSYGFRPKSSATEALEAIRVAGNQGYNFVVDADREFHKMDTFVTKSLRRWQHRRGGQRPRKRPPFTVQQLYGMDLHRLMATLRYPAQATPRRSSLSRVPDNGMHGLKGSSMAQGRF